MNELYATLIAAAGILVSALASFLVSWMKSRALSKKIIALEDFFNSDETEYYVECPKCGNKIILNKVKIFCEKQKEATK